MESLRHWDLRLPHTGCHILVPWPGLNAHKRLEGTGCAPGLVSSGESSACVLWNCAQQTSAQQIGMSGRIASKARSKPKHLCYWMVGLPSQFLLHQFLIEKTVISVHVLSCALFGENKMKLFRAATYYWSCVPNEHTTMQWAIFWYYSNSRVVLEQMCGQERIGRYRCIYLQHIWQVQKCAHLYESVGLNDRKKDRETDDNFCQYLGKA